MITKTSEPTKEFLSAYRPLKWVVTSDRYANTVNTSVPISDNGSGKCRFTKNGHGYLDGDLIVVTANAVPGYGVVHQITWISVNVFDSQIAYSSVDTVTCTRNNTNFQIKAEVVHFNSTRVAISSVTNPGAGEITVNTGAAHGYIAGDIVSIEDSATYDYGYEVISVGSPTAFNVANTYTTTATGYTRKGEVVGTKAQKLGASFTFDFMGIMQAVLTKNIELLTGTTPRIVVPTDESAGHFSILFTEQHDNISGLLTDFDTTLSKKKIAINSTLQHEDTQNFDDYIITATASTTEKFLTDSPRTLYSNPAKWVQLSFLIDTATLIKVRQIKYLNGTPDTIDSTAAQCYGKRAIAMVQLPTGADYVEIFLINASAQQISEKITIYTETNSCNNRVWFMNLKGGFDFYEFTGMQFKDVDSDKQRYTRPIDDGFAVNERGLTDIHTNSTEHYELYSQYESEATMIWLEQLMSSPEVYIESGSNLIPITLVEHKLQSINPEDMPQMSIRYIKSNTKIVQK